MGLGEGWKLGYGPIHPHGLEKVGCLERTANKMGLASGRTDSTSGVGEEVVATIRMDTKEEMLNAKH